MWNIATDFIKGIFEPAANLIDNVHTSDEEKLQLRNAFAKLQNEVTVGQIELLSKQMELESQLLSAKASVINAEAKSESWIASSWRPITMLTFVVIVVLNAVGIIILEAKFAEDFMTLVQIGLGGYVVGRSAEKVAPAVAKAIERK